jgi:hypothetical protein
MNRPVRSRMQGGVGAGGEKPPATRFSCELDLITRGLYLLCHF